MQLSFYVKKNKKHLKKSLNGCSVTVSADIAEKKKVLNEEIKNILKQYKNDADKILGYIAKHKTKVFKLANAKKILETINEEEGLIPAYSGIKALVLSTVLFKKPSLKTDAMFIVDENVDIYYLIQQFHRWYYCLNEFEGFDAKSQFLLKQVNKGKEDSIIQKLKPDDIISLRNAIARDVESISFVEQYARETAGSKKALDKIKNGCGASI